jgi:ribonuclease D
MDTQLLFPFWVDAPGEKTAKCSWDTTDKIGLKDLIRIFTPDVLKYSTNSTLSDWRLRPGHGMTTEQIHYATNDVHPLLRIFDKMRNDVSIID